MKEYINLTAKLYDPLLRSALWPLRRAMKGKMQANKEMNVLDMCCGTGNQLIYLAQNGFTKLHGLDLSEDMLAIGKKTNHSIRFYLEDAANTSFADASFDFIMISLALHEKDYMTQKNVLMEIARLIRPDGYVFIADFLFDQKTSLWSKTVISLIEKISGGEHYQNFKNYIRRGGIPHVVPKDVFTFIELDRVLLKGLGIWTFQKTAVN